MRESRQALIDMGERRRDRIQQSRTGFGGRDAARGPGQQSHIEARLEIAHGVAQRGGRNAELRSGAREAAFLGHRGEGEQIVEVIAFHS